MQAFHNIEIDFVNGYKISRKYSKSKIRRKVEKNGIRKIIFGASPTYTPRFCELQLPRLPK